MRDYDGRGLREGAVLVFLSLLMGSLTWAFHPRAPDFPGNTADSGALEMAQVRQFPGEWIWVDARTETEYREGHIPGAVWVSEDDFDPGLMNLLEVWRPDQGILVYCGGGECQASKAVARRLEEALGIEEVYWLKGGIESWDGSIQDES